MVLARAAGRQTRELNAQDVANTVWAFATAGEWNGKQLELFGALARLFWNKITSKMNINFLRSNGNCR